MALAAGDLPPSEFENAPKVMSDLQIFYDAFLELTTCRSVGAGGVGPIPWTAIVKYAEVEGFGGDDAEDLIFFTRALDSVFMDWMDKK